MKKYQVEIERLETFYINVEAENEDQAEEVATNLLHLSPQNGAEYSNDIQEEVTSTYEM